MLKKLTQEDWDFIKNHEFTYKVETATIKEIKEQEAIIADQELWEDVHDGSYCGDYWD